VSLQEFLRIPADAGESRGDGGTFARTGWIALGLPVFRRLVCHELTLDHFGFSQEFEDYFRRPSEDCWKDRLGRTYTACATRTIRTAERLGAAPDRR